MYKTTARRNKLSKKVQAIT